MTAYSQFLKVLHFYRICYLINGSLRLPFLVCNTQTQTLFSQHMEEDGEGKTRLASATRFLLDASLYAHKSSVDAVHFNRVLDLN